VTKSTGHFLKSTLLITVFSFLSRVLGLLRSTLLSSFYGATKSNGTIDCYIAAYRLPDIVFNLIAAGSISIVLIPYFSGLLKKDDRETLNRACSGFLNFFFIVMTVILIVVFFFAEPIVTGFLVKGWTDQNNIKLTVLLSRILLIQVLFLTLSGVFGSYLNSIEKFLSFSLALLSYNVGIIIGILFFAPFFGIVGVVCGAVLGSLIHLLIQLTGSVKNGFRYHLVLPEFNREVRNLFAVAVPRIIAISADQLVRFTIISFASFIFTGSMIIFDNVENVGMIFYGILAVSVSTTAFPGFVKLFNEGKYDELYGSLFDKIRFLLFLILPSTVLMIVFRREIVDILFHYVNYNVKDSILTSNALLFYLSGIPFLSMTILTVKFYYAMQKSLIPMFAALAAITITIISTYYLSRSYAISGLAIGRSIGFMVQALILMAFIVSIRKKFGLTLPLRQIFDSLKIVLASAVMFAAGFAVHKYFAIWNDSKIIMILYMTLIGGIISILYVALCLLLKNPEAAYFKKKIFGKKNGAVTE
jgi:putative peptidoglycan lipid II flippase